MRFSQATIVAFIAATTAYYDGSIYERRGLDYYNNDYSSLARRAYDDDFLYRREAEFDDDLYARDADLDDLYERDLEAYLVARGGWQKSK